MTRALVHPSTLMSHSRETARREHDLVSSIE